MQTKITKIDRSQVSNAYNMYTHYVYGISYMYYFHSLGEGVYGVKARAESHRNFRFKRDSLEALVRRIVIFRSIGPLCCRQRVGFIHCAYTCYVRAYIYIYIICTICIMVVRHRATGW